MFLGVLTILIHIAIFVTVKLTSSDVSIATTLAAARMTTVTNAVTNMELLRRWNRQVHFFTNLNPFCDQIKHERTESIYIIT